MTYWEINPEKDPRDVANAAAKLIQEGRWPTPGTKVLAHYVSASIPMWGFTVVECENEDQMYNNLLAWIKELPGIFSKYKVAPLQTAEDAIKLALK